MPETVIEVLQRTASAHADRPAMRVKRDGQWQITTWKDYGDQALLAARGFLHLGLQPGQGVVIMGYNRPEWFVADLGAIAAGGLPAGIYTTFTPEQCQYIAEHAEAAVAVLENEQYLRVFLSIRDRLPALKAIVLMTGAVPGGTGDGVYSWSQLLEMGGQVPESELRARIDAQKPDDVCTLIYTSGTTGPPKAVMLSHHNVTWTAGKVAEAYGVNEKDDLLSYLPLSHIAEQIVSLHAPMGVGGCSWFAESLEKLGENLREVRPQFFFAVPRVWEKMQAAIQAAGAQNPPLKKKIAAWARGVGLEAGDAEQAGRSKPFLYGLAHKLVFSKVHARLGLDRARVCATSTAPISMDTLRFFLSLGIPILEVYGMSECTGPATFSYPNRFRLGKVGVAIDGTEVRTAEDGEVMMRGPHVFKGYYKNEAATKETVDDEGWLHSGDIGELDAEGFLRITDRKKDLIITSGGKNIGPQILEGKLKQIPVVSQAVVIGDRRNYLVALLALDPLRAPLEAEAAGSPHREPKDLAGCEIFRKHLEKQVEGVNQTLARYETIKRFAVLPRELSIEDGELTPTMKLKRRVILQSYAEEIERLYA
ncbi:MAG TPA: AMP-binding protein [Thermoanaerobaculia bacterium]|nr:AMP-binding protein [Thermoanaerobaculia bacterium]